MNKHQVCQSPNFICDGRSHHMDYKIMREPCPNERISDLCEQCKTRPSDDYRCEDCRLTLCEECLYDGKCEKTTDYAQRHRDEQWGIAQAAIEECAK